MNATDRTEYPAPATRLDRGSFRRLARCGGAPIGMLFALALAGCDENSQSQAAAPPPPPVTVAQPVKRTVTDWDEFTGRFEAIQEVQVRARVGGFVTNVEARAVELGPIDEDVRVIRTGLKPEDRVIIDGIQRAHVGAKVAPHKGEINGSKS